MTWVVGGNCFNGFVCVADIQATIKYSNNKPDVHFNCVQKIHKVFDNLCIAFSGDIRSGLLIIEDLSIQLSGSIKENEYFDIDGQSSLLIKYLKKKYKEINPKSSPYLELMFLWTAQEGDKLFFRPFCMKFKSPEFRMNSTHQLGVAQSGSGIDSENYGVIASFLSAKPDDSEVHKNIFGDSLILKKIWTVQKFKKFIFHEASSVNYKGVSKTFISFESEIEYKDIYPDHLVPILKKIYIELGVEYSKEESKNDGINMVTMDLEKMDYKIKELEKNDPDRFEIIQSVLSTAKSVQNFNSLSKLPSINSDYFTAKNEEIHSEKLISNWADMESFLKGKKIYLKKCTAIA